MRGACRPVGQSVYNVLIGPMGAGASQQRTTVHIERNGLIKSSDKKSASPKFARLSQTTIAGLITERARLNPKLSFAAATGITLVAEQCWEITLGLYSSRFLAFPPPFIPSVTFSLSMSPSQYYVCSQPTSTVFLDLLALVSLHFSFVIHISL